MAAELAGLQAPVEFPALAELPAGDHQALDVTLQPRDGIPGEAPEPVELPASDEARVARGETPVELDEAAVRGVKPPSWDEPPASAEAHWV